jgi:hypothetical protein
MTNTQTQDLTALVRGEFATKGSAVSIADILAALNAEPEVTTGESFKDIVPKKVKATDVQLDALDNLPRLLEELKVPSTRREVTKPEAETVNALRVAAGHLDKLVKAIYDTTREIVLNDGDVRAERLGTVDADTPRDKSGHYIVEDDNHFAVVGQDERLGRQPSEPKVAISLDLLLGLVESKKLTPRTFNGVTDEVRVVNDNKLLEAVRKDPKLAPVFAQAAVSKGGSVSVVVKRNQD